MPELPDVAHFNAYLDAKALHKTIRRVEVLDRGVLEDVSPRRLRESLQGESLESSWRHGKYLFVATSAAPILVMHFGMTGFLVYEPSDSARTAHARVVFLFDDGFRLDYVCQRKLGRVALTADADEFLKDRQIGPDALDGMTLRRFRKRVAGRRGTIKATLMNQWVLAGIGNVYSDEILFRAGIHPSTAVGDLDDDAVKRIHYQMRRVLATAAKRGADPSRMPPDYLLPRRDAGANCPRCGEQIAKLSISGRTAYFCPRCQGD